MKKRKGKDRQVAKAELDEDDKYLPKGLKKYLKQHPPPKIEGRRTKKDPLSIYAIIADFGKDVRKADAWMGITVTALPEDWKKLAEYVPRDGFGWHFWNNFITPAIAKIEECPLRGRHKFYKRENADGKLEAVARRTEDKKVQALALFVWLQYWFKRPEKEWPSLLWKLIAMADEDEIIIKTPRGRYSPRDLTEYALIKAYPELEKLEADSIYITYIHNPEKKDRKVSEG